MKTVVWDNGHGCISTFHMPAMERRSGLGGLAGGVEFRHDEIRAEEEWLNRQRRKETANRFFRGVDCFGNGATLVSRRV